MTGYKLTLISGVAISPKLDTVRAELIARGFTIHSERNLNPEFNHRRSDPAGDAYSFTFKADFSLNQAKSLCQHFSTTFALDAVIQDSEQAEKPKKLVCFDMDSTLIQHEVMDELAYEFGIGEKISAITESAMRGEISFMESFDQRLACLEGFDALLLPGIARRLELTQGAQILVNTLRANETKITILSGGFENFAIFLRNTLGPIDAIYANILEIKDGRLTGKISNELVNETRKLTLIKELAKKQGINADQTIAVGDGANDIPMLLHAGLGIAFRAKPLVQEKVPHCINHSGLAAILYVLGYQRSQFIEQQDGVPQHPGR